MADVCKSAVAIVVEQPARHRVVDAWDAVVALAGLRVAAKLVLGLVEIHKPANKEVKFSVVVVVKPDGTRCPALGGQASFPGHIGKRAVAVVVVENDAVVLRHKEVGQAVAVVIAGRHTHPIPAAADAGLFGHVSECSVAIVPVKRIAER